MLKNLHNQKSDVINHKSRKIHDSRFFLEGMPIPLPEKNCNEIVTSLWNAERIRRFENDVLSFFLQKVAFKMKFFTH